MSPHDKWFRVLLGAVGYSLIIFYGNWQTALGVYILLFNVNIDFDILRDFLQGREKNATDE